MKKVLFVLAFVAIYGVSLAMTQSTTISVEETIVVVDDKVEKEEKKAKATSEAKGEGCSESKAKACSGEKAKSDCSSKKSADCSSKCSGKKK